MNISYLPKGTYEKNPTALSFEGFLNDIKNDRWWELVAAHRKGNTPDPFPAVMPSALAEGGHGKDKITEYTGIICMDIDGIGDTIKETRERLQSDPHLLACFESRGGNGLALFFRYPKPRSNSKDPNAHHVKYWRALQKYLADKYYIEADRQTNNVNRLRFVSHDPNLYHNPDAATWTKAYEREVSPLPQYERASLQSDLDYVIEQVQRNYVDLTQDSYDNVLRIGLPLAAKYGESGRGYFHQLCQYSAKYDADWSDRKYDNFVRTANGRRGMGTLFLLAKENGLEIRHPDNAAALLDAGFVKKNGKPKQEALAELAEKHPDVTPQDLEVIYHAVDASQAASAGPQGFTLVDRGLAFIKTKYNPLYDTIKQRVRLNGKIMDNRAFNGLVADFMRNFDGQKGASKDLARTLLESNEIPETNLFLDYLKSLPAPSGNAFKNAVEAIPTTSLELMPDGTPYAYWVLRKWLLGLMATVVDGKSNDIVPVFCGKHGRNKSAWFANVLPPHLSDDYYTENSVQDDVQLLLSSFLIVCDEEFGGISQKDEKRFKALVSAKRMSLRKKFQTYMDNVHRTASLCGTSNTDQLFSDLTGNRRICPIRIGEMTRDMVKTIDHDDLLSEIYHAYIGGEQEWPTFEEIDWITEYTDQYRRREDLEDRIAATFVAGIDGDPRSQWYTLSEVADAALEGAKTRPYTTRNVGDILKKLGLGETKPKWINGTTAKRILLINVRRSEPDAPF